MPDIFDQVAGGTAPKGDIFDQVAPTKKPSPFRDVIEKAFNALYGMNLGQGEEALYGTPTGRAPSAPGKMGFFEKNVIPESPPVPLSEREMYLSPTPGAPPRPQESIRSGEHTPAMDTLKAHGKNILSAADQVHAHTMDLMAGLGKIIEEAVPGYSGTWLKQKYQELARKDRELAEEFKTDPQGAADKLTKTVLQGVVSLGDPTLPLMANPAAFGAVSAIAAYGQGRPVDQSIIDGLKSGIVAKGFGKVHGLKPTEAAGKMGAIGATEAATGTPGGIEEKALAGLEGGVTQGIFGGMAASRLGPKGREAYKTNAPIVGHEKALEIARTVEAQKSPKGDIFDRVAGVSTELRTEKPTIKYTEGGDALGKEYHGYITAIDEATGKPAGRVDYSYWNGETAVKMIEVDPEYRRMGIATDLLKKLQADSKEPIKIQGNFATEEGQALWKKFAPEMPQDETGKATMPPAPEKPQGGETVKAGGVENTVRGDIIPPVSSKRGPGDKTTEATPKPDGGIKLEDGRVLPDGYYIRHEDDWGGKAWKVYTQDAALVGYDKSNKEWALNQAWQRVASGDIPNPKHKKLSSFAEADPNKLRELLGQKELFYRVHGKNEKFHKDLAFSSIIDGSNKRKGYSSYDNPEDLIDYWSGNNPSNRSISDDAEVVIYSGKKVGKGGDNEPLSVPDMKVVYRTTWKKLLSAVELNPNQSRPPEMGGKTVPPEVLKDYPELVKKEPRAGRSMPDIGESPKGIPARKTPPIITTEQKKRQAKAKAVKEQQLKVESAEDAKKAVHSMIRERRYRLNLATYESNLFINEIERSTSREQREVIPFIIENTDVPKGLSRPDLEKIHAAEKANLAPIARQVKDHFDKGWQKMKESTPDMSAEQIEDYVTHIWDIPKGKKREVTSWFTTQNRFLKKRFIETINEGVEKFGLQPKTLDISEIIRIHDSVMNRVIENNRFVEDLKKLRKDGVPLIERADKAPQDWAYFDHPALRRGLIIPGEAKMGEKVSPELADILAEMGVAIGRRISPVTFGKPTWKAGEYRPGDTPEVRFQRFMSNRTIAHEIGHHLDAALGLGDKFLNKYKTELYEVNRKRIESFAGTDKEAYAKSTEEQIAEFFATLFTNPDLASRVAPTATADALTKLKGDGILTKLVGFDFEKNAKNLIEERLDTMVKLPVKVHPDLEAPLKVIFESRMTHPAIQAFETMNGILKKTELSLSLFHHVALGETGIATMGLPKTLGIYFNPVKIFKAMWRGEYDIYKKEPIARDAIEHGLQVGATSDIPVNMIQTKLNDMARKTRNVLVINKATALLRTFNEQWDKALWNYLHDTLKLQGYESLCAKMDPTKDIKAQKEEIAQFVNDTFGGQNWDVLMVSPKSLQLMSWFLLSPDWTLSTLRQALAPTGIGTIHKEAGSALRKKMGAHFWIKAGLYFGLGINMLNYMNRKRDEKEHPEYYEGEERGFLDRTMAGNTIGHKTHLFAGRYEDGTERYVRWGKQFRELPEMFFDDTGFSPISATIKKIGGKMAPALQLASSILTGSSLSGFRNDDINGKEGWDKVYGIAKTILKSPFPFSSRTLFDENKEFHATDLAMPSSKGMTRYRSMELFKLAVAKGDERMLKEVYQDTLRNNLPAYTLFNASLAQLKAESTKEYNEGLKSIADIQERAKQVETPLEVARLARIMKRMIKENADRMAGMKLLDAAILNLKKYQILNEAEAGSKK